MKKNLLCLAMIASLSGFSQSSILLNIVGGATLAPNATVAIGTAANSGTNITLDIKNISGTSKNYNAKRYDIQLHSTGTATASAYFCFAGSCYGAGTFSAGPLALPSNTSASQLPGLYNMLVADLDEANTVGISIVKYTFWNANLISDSVQVTLKYNGPQGINETANLFSSFDLSPNPISDFATFKINSAKAMEGKLCIYNALGAIVNEKQVALTEGKNKIDFNAETLPSGVYFACIKSGNYSTTKKFIVR